MSLAADEVRQLRSVSPQPQPLDYGSFIPPELLPETGSCEGTGRPVPNVHFHYAVPVLGLQNLALGLAGGVVTNMEVSYFKDNSVMVVGLVSGITGLFACVTVPFIGALSDSIGRKRLMLLSCVLDVLPFGTLVATENMVPYEVLMCVSGIFRGTYALVSAYIADCTTIEERTRAMATAYAAFGASLVLGPTIGALVYDRYGRKAVFVCVLSVLASAVAYIALLLPESLPARRTKTPFKESLDHFKQRRHSLNPFKAMALLLQNDVLIVTTVIAAVDGAARNGFFSTFFVYLSAELRFSVDELSRLIALFGLAMIVSNAVVVPLLSRCMPEKPLIVMALLAQSLQMLMFGSAQDNKGVIYATVLFTMFTTMSSAALSAVSSAAVLPTDQGKLQGALGSVAAICNGVSPVLYSVLLTAAQSTRFAGSPYALGGVMVLAIGVYALAKLPRSAAAAKEMCQVTVSVEDTEALS